MKWLAAVSFVVCLACNPKEQEYRKAEDALDAGREYIQSCLTGDFSKAAYYTVGDEINLRLVKQTEDVYRQKDKEGRQQFRNASINIHEITVLTDSTTFIQYSNSFDKEPHRLTVVKRDNNWQVDLSKK